jgi:hypothetical protein
MSEPNPIGHVALCNGAICGVPILEADPPSARWIPSHFGLSTTSPPTALSSALCASAAEWNHATLQLPLYATPSRINPNMKPDGCV